MLSNIQYLILEWVVENNGTKYIIANKKICCELGCQPNTFYHTMTKLRSHGLAIKTKRILVRSPYALEITQKGLDYYKLHRQLMELL